MSRIGFLLAAIFLCLVGAQQCFAQTPGVKLVSKGEYKDKDGAVHAWRVDGAHTLYWDGQPYIPVGGVFYSRYICIDQTEDNWQADIRSLESIKNAGITDLLLKSIRPITLTKPEAWQKLLDYLDSSGFTYGIDLADGPKTHLTGIIVEPSRYRVPDIIKDETFIFDMPDVTSALWMLCSASTGSVLSNGGASVTNGKVKIQVKSRPDQTCVLLVYPSRELSNDNKPAGVYDLWSGFDDYRDLLLTFVSKIKFGKGLRFFVDPLTSKMDFEGEMTSLIPDSSDYRLEFEAYLAKKYLNIGSLNAAWALSGSNIASFQEAARLIPLWHGTRGIQALYDRARGERHTVDSAHSTIWNDIVDFRDSSAQNYMNIAADVLKRNAADVPVIYKANRQHRILANSRSRGGFDGLGVESYGHGLDLITNAAGQVYSVSEDAVRSMWYVVTGTQDTASKSKSVAGYDNKERMFADLDTLAEIGSKGIFVLGLQVLPEDEWKNHSLSLLPDQMGWLKEFKDKFISTDRANYIPQVVYFPSEPVVGAEIKRLGPGQWWLPSLRMGTAIMEGDTIGAYTVPGQDGVCIWSRSGPFTATFPLSADQKPKLIYPSGANGLLSVEKKKKTGVRATLKLDESPVIISGIDPLQAFPIEMVENELTKLGPLVEQAKAAGARVPNYEVASERARSVLKSGRSAIAYDIARTFVKEIGNEVGVYFWIEGEQSVSHNFDKVESLIRASAGGCLVLDTKSVPPMTPYTAIYPLTITKDGMHEIWLAGLPIEKGASPFSFSIDNNEWQQGTEVAVSEYCNNLAWMKIGSANLTKGIHTLQIKIDDVNPNGSYKFAIDAIAVSPSTFKPDGVKKP
jgi:hypothetical protein